MILRIYCGVDLRVIDWFIGLRLPRDIQAEAIPLILGGGDVLAVSYDNFVDLKKN